MSRVEHIGDATLYLGDCREILPTLGFGWEVITDPPYGLGDLWQGGKAEWPLHHGNVEWDADAMAGLRELLLVRSDKCIVWGGHLYDLPRGRGWLIWDKLVRNFTSGHCEMAWTNIDQPIRAFSYAHGELASEGKFHPTQKPVPLMEWCIGFTKLKVLDPFMGSGSTGVACAKLGRSFCGVEREVKWFDVACRRIEQAHNQADLFVKPAAKAQQLELVRPACVRGHCRAPIACEGFGYCRLLNMSKGVHP